MKEISYQELLLNPVTTIADNWWLITAGTEVSGYNTMTASWGQLGSVWSHGEVCPTAVVYIRPQRYTKEFVDREDLFTLSVMGSGFRRELGYLGSRSGRDEDKLAAMGMKPLFLDGTTAIEGAELIFVCRKLYCAPLREEYFLDRELMEKCYPERDFHYEYVGRIEKILIKD